MKIKHIIPVALIPLILLGCETGGVNTKKTSLEIQAFQKKEFETTKKVAFASTVSVFQDMGYIVKNASFETGLIQAASPTKATVFFGSHMSNVEATAFVEDLTPVKSSIRLNFVSVNESSSGYGEKTKADRPIMDPKLYENAFTKIQEAIFIRTKTQ